MNEALLTPINREVGGWAGVSTSRSVHITVYSLGQREIGHIHDDGVADIQFPRAIRDELVASGRAQPHRGGFAAVISYPIRTPDDVPGAIELFRMSYDRIKTATDRRAATKAAAGT